MVKVKYISKQINRLNKICYDNSFRFNRVIYEILNCNELMELLLRKPVPKNIIEVDNRNIAFEEKFIENLDNYVNCIEAHFRSLADYDRIQLIKLSLSNKYVDILYSTLDFNKLDNRDFFINNFIRLFLFNLYDNLMYYFSLNIDEPYISRFADDIKNLDFENDEDIELIENIFGDVLRIRKDNIYQSCVPYKTIEKREYDRFIQHLEWILSEYYDEIVREAARFKELIHKAKTSKQNHKENIIFFTVNLIIIIILFIALYLIKQNEDFSYTLNGESDNFSYRDVLFYKSDNIYYISYGHESIKNPNIDEEDIISMSLKCNDYLIIRASFFPKGLHSERVGYNEMFPKNVVDDIDDWILEVVYMIDNEEVKETIHLEKSDNL